MLQPFNIIWYEMKLFTHKVPVQTLWTWTKSTPQKKCFSGQILIKLKVAITSFKEMLELPNFDHITTFANYIRSNDNVNLLSCRNLYSMK